MLYVGMTMADVGRRLLDHRRKWLYKYRGNIQVRLGLVMDGLSGDLIFDNKNVLLDVEGALIFETSPLRNLKAVSSYRYYHQFLIQNIGYRGKMPRVVDMQDH